MCSRVSKRKVSLRTTILMKEVIRNADSIDNLLEAFGLKQPKPAAEKPMESNDIDTEINTEYLVELDNVSCPKSNQDEVDDLEFKDEDGKEDLLPKSMFCDFGKTKSLESIDESSSNSSSNFEERYSEDLHDKPAFNRVRRLSTFVPRKTSSGVHYTSLTSSKIAKFALLQNTGDGCTSVNNDSVLYNLHDYNVSDIKKKWQLKGKLMISSNFFTQTLNNAVNRRFSSSIINIKNEFTDLTGSVLCHKIPCKLIHLSKALSLGKKSWSLDCICCESINSLSICEYDHHEGDETHPKDRHDSLIDEFETLSFTKNEKNDFDSFRQSPSQKISKKTLSKTRSLPLEKSYQTRLDNMRKSLPFNNHNGIGSEIKTTNSPNGVTSYLSVKKSPYLSRRKLQKSPRSKHYMQPTMSSSIKSVYYRCQ